MIINIVYGLLGAGKTTFIRRILEHPPEGEKLVVLVNEFGDVGIDRRVMEMHGSEAADIVEMASGCVCCTMSSDFRRQIIELHDRYSPDRMIIEPSGVAVIRQLMSIFKRADIRALFTDLRLIHIVDSSEFLRLFKSNRNFVVNQIRAAHVVILNKIDRLKPRMADVLASSVKEIHPEAEVCQTSFCSLEPLRHMTLFGSGKAALHLTAGEEPLFFQDIPPHFESFARRFDGDIFNPVCLSSFFKDLASLRYGEISRAKGIFRTPDASILIELASGEIQDETVSASKESVVSVIGKNLDSKKLDNHLKNCIP